MRLSEIELRGKIHAISVATHVGAMFLMLGYFQSFFNQSQQNANFEEKDRVLLDFDKVADYVLYFYYY